MTIRLLHFADAHIDMANYGRHDPETGLPLRVLDFLKSLDTIIDTAIAEKVDLVIFAGDAYKDRSPAPTFQREWGRRIIRLSQAGIRTLLLVGNHDLSPAIGRANAIQEFDTLAVPYITVLSKPQFLSSQELGLPVQVVAIPWIARSGLVAATDTSPADGTEVFANIEQRLTDLVEGWLDKADPILPTILTAHASVQGAKYGSERTVMLGADLVLPGSLVRDGRLDYVALGHIHKPQDLNGNAHPPVIYPGSIERVDFGEAGDDKFFIIAEVEKGHTQVEWRQLTGVRPFIDRYFQLESPEDVTATLERILPAPEQFTSAIMRLTVDYPREWDSLIDEPALRLYAQSAFEFHLIKRPQIESRIRLPADQTVSSLSPLDLLDQYWLASKAEDTEMLQKMAREIIEQDL
ncbi:MAG: exonuclease SbcCD subunit D [Anaerolineales bacterium]|jgi:exonuclease SbcD